MRSTKQHVLAFPTVFGVCRLRTDGGSKNKTLQKFVFLYSATYRQTFTMFRTNSITPEGEILTPFKSGSVLNARQQSPADDWHMGSERQQSPADDWQVRFF